MDRVDLFIQVPQIKYEKLVSSDDQNFSQKIRERVERARKIQRERFSNKGFAARVTNSEMEIPQIKRYCQIDSRSQNLLRNCVDSGNLSARGYHRVLKVARTIADLDDSENILYDHLAEAIMYRVKEE
jgi:magnesium chelatase family protein